MDTPSILQAVIATVVTLVGFGSLAWSVRGRRSIAAQRPVASRPATASPISATPPADAAPHPSWLGEPDDPPAPNLDPTVVRRAAVLSGLQLAVLATLLLGGIYLASTVTADQLVRLGR